MGTWKIFEAFYPFSTLLKPNNQRDLVMTIQTETEINTKTGHLTPIQEVSPELRAEWAAKAKASRDAEKRETADYTQNFADANHWRELASSAGVKLPAYWRKPTTGRTMKYARKLSIDAEAIRDVFACSVKGLIEVNPQWPLWAIVGLLLEIFAEREGISGEAAV